VLPFVAALLLTASGRAQQLPTFGASAELVVIDLIATDDDGRFVSDLRAEEIEVQEGGKPQRVEFVRLITVGGSSPQDAGTDASAPPPATPAAGPLFSAVPTLSLVVVVDLATLSFDLLAHTREAVVKMARTELEPGTRLMLVTLDRGLQVRHGFTHDVQRFAQAVEALAPSAGDGGEASLAELVDQVEDTCPSAPESVPGARQNAIGLGRAYVENARLSLTGSTEGLAAVARYLAPLPGRKHVVYYSAGHPMDPAAIASMVVEGICGPTPGGSQSFLQAGSGEAQTALRVGASVDSTGLLQALVDAANRAQVSVYTVDARGLVSDAVSARQRAPTRLLRGGAVQAIQQQSVRAPQAILYSIADGTGGTASINTNELARGMRAAASDARGYYLLAYAPPGDRREGRYYPIEVKLKRPGLRARYRRGYEWLSEAKRSERAIAAALRFPGLYAEDGLALDPWLEGGKLNVAVILPTRALAFRSEGALYRNELLLQGLLRDERGRPVGDHYLFTKTIDMKLPEARYADLRSRENVEIASDAPLPKSGRYQLAVVVRHSGGRLASATAEVVVP
jgi:VWFA-related protein